MREFKVHIAAFGISCLVPAAKAKSAEGGVPMSLQRKLARTPSDRLLVFVKHGHLQQRMAFGDGTRAYKILPIAYSLQTERQDMSSVTVSRRVRERRAASWCGGGAYGRN